MPWGSRRPGDAVSGWETWRWAGRDGVGTRRGHAEGKRRGGTTGGTAGAGIGERPVHVGPPRTHRPRPPHRTRCAPRRDGAAAPVPSPGQGEARPYPPRTRRYGGLGTRDRYAPFAAIGMYQALCGHLTCMSLLAGSPAPPRATAPQRRPESLRRGRHVSPSQREDVPYGRQDAPVRRRPEHENAPPRGRGVLAMWCEFRPWRGCRGRARSPWGR